MTDANPPSKPLLDSAAQRVDPAIPADTVIARPRPRDPVPVRQGRFFALRREIPTWQSLLFAALFIAIVAALWFFVTRGEEDRMVRHSILPSPEETF
jgi:hypothetical protein